MTPKEKAVELYSKYYNRIEHTLSEQYSQSEIDVVKECAIIAVDEIINSMENVWDNTVEYWKEVKQEIEKL